MRCSALEPICFQVSFSILRRPMNESAKRVLVIFPGALGDLICLVPTLRALIPRHRGSSIELMAREELARFAVDRMGVAAPHSIDRQEVAVLFRSEEHTS